MLKKTLKSQFKKQKYIQQDVFVTHVIKFPFSLTSSLKSQKDCYLNHQRIVKPSNVNKQKIKYISNINSQHSCYQRERPPPNIVFIKQ